MSAARRPEGAAAAQVFAALGDPIRLSLVRRLGDGAPRSVSELTQGTRVTRQAVTKHLRVLEGAGVVQGRREGRETRFKLVPGPLEDARDCLGEIARQWDDALARLKAFVER